MKCTKRCRVGMGVLSSNFISSCIPSLHNDLFKRARAVGLAQDRILTWIVFSPETNRRTQTTPTCTWRSVIHNSTIKNPDADYGNRILMRHLVFPRSDAVGFYWPSSSAPFILQRFSDNVFEQPVTRHCVIQSVISHAESCTPPPYMLFMGT